MPNPPHAPRPGAKVQGLDQTSRLADLPDYASIIVRCRCDQHRAFHDRDLERKHGVPPEITIEELAGKLRCRDCGARGPFRISWRDERLQGKEHLLVLG